MFIQNRTSVASTVSPLDHLYGLSVIVTDLLFDDQTGAPARLSE